jgi:putative ABC transport system permease protein
MNLIQRSLRSIQVFRESMISAIQAVGANKLRSFLSTLGISIGIFCIIFVFTLVDSLQRNIHESIDALGSNVVMVQKWPIMFTNDYPWWKFINRPVASFKEYEKLKEALADKANCCLYVNYNGKYFKYGTNTVENSIIIACTKNYERIRSFDLAYGRYFSDMDINMGTNSIVIGNDIAEGLFEKPERALGRTINMDGRKVVVIGVIKKEGSNLLQTSMDNAAIISYNYARGFLSLGYNFLEPNIYVKPVDNASLDFIKDETRKEMRALRHLPPGTEDNFAINEFSMITNAFDSLLSILWIVGAIIGGFSILVGCFGVANIMFVSVKERTHLIGIQKAIGAKRNFILLQFLVEAIVLCIIGGLIGLSFVGIAVMVARIISFTLVLSTFNITIGLSIAFAIGIIAGIIPAINAGRLDPVVAMRSR